MTRRNIFKFNKKRTEDPTEKDSWYKFLFHRKRKIIKSLIGFFIIAGIMFGSFMTVSFLGKDVSIHFFTDLNIDEYDEISLIAEREDEEYKLLMDLDEKSSTFKIPKTSSIEGIELKKDIVISEDYSEEILESYSHDTSIQINTSGSNTQFIEGIEYNPSEYINYTASSNNYKGVYSFFYNENEQEPSNFNLESGFASIKKEYMGRSKVACLEEITTISDTITPISNGTFEFEVNVNGGQDFMFELFDGNDYVIRIKSSCVENTIYYWYLQKWRNSQMIGSATMGYNTWANIRIDMRSDNAPIYMGLQEGYYDIYLNDDKIYEDRHFIRYAESINKIKLSSVKPFDKVYFDSVGFTNTRKELVDEIYQIGEKKESWNAIDKSYYYNFKFPDVNYQNLKNATLSFSYEINATLNSDRESGLRVYNFYDAQWEYLKIFNSKKTMILDITDIRYFNDTKSNETDIHFELLLSNVLFDFNASKISLNCSGWFWKEITQKSYKITNTFEGELSIDIIITDEYKEKEIIITSTIEINYFFCFGSWVLNETTLIKHIIIIHEQIYEFDFDDDISLFDDTFYGWRLVEIEITKIDLNKKEIDTKTTVGELYA